MEDTGWEARVFTPSYVPPAASPPPPCSPVMARTAELGQAWLSQQWRRVQTSSGASPSALAFAVPAALHVGVYWSLGLAILALDRARLLSRFRLQPAAEDAGSGVGLGRCARRVLINQLVFTVLPPAAAYWLRGDAVARRILARRVPGVPTAVAQLAFFLVCHEIAFYLTQRLLHYGPLYRHVHKQHHELRAPLSIGAEYCHPAEMALGNVLPVLVGPALVKAHVGVEYAWVVLSVLITLAHHSGFDLPVFVGLFKPDFHDYPHMTSSGNYGFVGFMDRLFGTDKGFRAHQAKQRAAAGGTSGATDS